MTIRADIPHAATDWLCHNLPAAWPQGSMQHVYLRLRNRGERPWPAAGGVQLVVRMHGQLHLTLSMPDDVAGGCDTVVNFPFIVPLAFLKSSSNTNLDFQLVDRSDIEPRELESLSVSIENGPAETDAPAEAIQIASFACSGFYLPTGGVSRGREGKLYPLFAREASGCRVRDLEGNEWIDYVMGWGSALLGYARPEITRAISAQLCSGAVLGLPHILELEVAQLLGDMIPCTETTLFGKNGSDVCTAAVRLARIHTGRQTILFSGYSGWQDPFAQYFEPELAKLDHARLAFHFPLNDLERLRELFEEHKGTVAAVMMEPAAQVEGVDGPVRDADPEFLRSLAELCQQRGALLIFDEIMTGFRYLSGSVQKATGVIPDLACFGKALTSAMPLSVLVGKSEIIRKVGRAFYHPTFKGEAYSMAAAAAALKIYRDENVPQRIDQFGCRLMEGIKEISVRHGIDGQMTGLPFRMVYRFDEPDGSRRTLLRTLLHQELLKRGILTFRGFMLPSTAHGDRELAQTLDAFDGALARVSAIAANNSFESALEIPPVV